MRRQGTQPGSGPNGMPGPRAPRCDAAAPAADVAPYFVVSAPDRAHPAGEFLLCARDRNARYQALSRAFPSPRTPPCGPFPPLRPPLCLQIVSLSRQAPRRRGTPARRRRDRLPGAPPPRSPPRELLRLPRGRSAVAGRPLQSTPSAAARGRAVRWARRLPRHEPTAGRLRGRRRPSRRRHGPPPLASGAVTARRRGPGPALPARGGTTLRTSAPASTRAASASPQRGPVPGAKAAPRARPRRRPRPRPPRAG